jgi:tRNA A-37 threonylcarbamoyl transferase component Bud32
MKKIDELIPIGAGKQAEIFEWEKERVLRLFFKDTAEEIVRQEAFIMKTLNTMDVPVPEFFELIELEGRRGIVMERIRGKNRSFS